MTITVRFAPKPTGRLQLDDARAAVINFLFARKSGGRFLLRLDDTDRDRSEKRFAREVEADMAWLGLDWDIFARQSDRLALYAGAAERLKASGRLYPHFATEEEPPDWCFRLGGPVAWDDLIRGRVELGGEMPNDPVLVRADDMPLSVFASVVDDIELEVTHVIQSEQHLAEAAVQLQIFAALGFPPPAFAHFPLLGGAPLGSDSIEALREDGIEPLAIDNLLAKFGMSAPIEPRLRLDELVAEFDLAKLGRASPRVDPSELRRLNAALLHALPYEAVAHRLPAGADRDFWEEVRSGLARFSDIAQRWQEKRQGEA